MYEKFQGDLSKIVALDCHVHIEVDNAGTFSLPQALRDAAAKYFKTQHSLPPIDEIADLYRKENMAAIVFTVEAATGLGHNGITSEFVATEAAKHSDVLIPFGSVDPHLGEAAIIRAAKLVRDYGVKGFKFHPTVQDFDPADEKYLTLFKEIEALDVPIIVHTGQTGIGAGTPGGFGLKLDYSNPMRLDKVAASCPNLQIIMAHPSVPWQDEALAVATHKANVWIDLSGWSPKYFPANLVKQSNSLLQDKVLFGSDYPLISPQRWLNDFNELEMKETVRPKILRDNAIRLLKLDN